MTTLLEMRGISKAFAGVKALSDVNFTVRQGEIHALVGENGAGAGRVHVRQRDAMARDRDMSEYQEEHTVSRLIGAPPGYVGFEEAGS